MFGGGNHMFVVNCWTRPLDRLHYRHCYTRGQVWIFAVGFFGAAPAWFTGDVEVWSQHLVTATGSRFQRAGSEDLTEEFRIPTTGQGDWLGKTGAALGHVSVQYFVVKNCRNTEARVLDQPLLEGVGKEGSFARTLAFSLASDLADAVLHYFFGFFRRQVTAVG
jgi:hypothetical protein